MIEYDDTLYGKVGDRVRLTREAGDEWHRLHAGATGTITYVDGVATRHVEWDDGSKLGILPDIDRWEVIG